MIPEEKAEEIKKQLISQIESTFPEEKKESAISKIELMNPEELEEFLIENNLIKSQTGQQTTSITSQGKCIFCSIVGGEVNSYKIDENKEAIAVLDINPISKGHIIIIPKKHITSAEELPKQAFSLAKKISKKLKSKLKPKNIKIGNSSFMNHEIINILPVYTSESLNSEKKQAKPEELEELKKILETIPKKPAKKRKIKKPETEEKKLWLPKRFP